MINKKLNLEECYEILSYLSDEGSFEYDLISVVYEEIFDKIYNNCKEDLIQDYFQILCNGTENDNFQEMNKDDYNNMNITVITI